MHNERKIRELRLTTERAADFRPAHLPLQMARFPFAIVTPGKYTSFSGFELDFV